MLRIKVFKDLENWINGESLSRDVEDKGETTLFKICLMCTMWWLLLENSGLDVCVKLAAGSVDLDTGSLIVWYICLHSPPQSSELRNQKGMVLTDRRPWLGPGSGDGDVVSLVRLTRPTRAGRCPEPVRGPGNPWHKAALIPEMYRTTCKCVEVWSNVWEIQGNIGIPKRRNMLYKSWGQILCSWFGGKKCSNCKAFLNSSVVMSDSLHPMDCRTPGFPVFQHLSRWWHPTISSSVIPFSSQVQSSLASGSFLMSWLFASGGQSIGASASASVPPMNIQDWFPLGLSSWISLQSKGLSRVFSNTTVQKHQFFGAQPSLWSNSHIHMWVLEKPQLWLYGPLLQSNVSVL